MKKMKGEFLPVSYDDMARRGWRELDVILVTGDAYVDHPSFGIAVIGRLLEASGFKVGIIPQPNWHSTHDFTKLGEPRLFFGISSGNVDSMIAHYTANKRRRKIDEYSPGNKTGLRPDRATIVYANRVREAFKGVPIVLGGLEASLRRFAHYDYWNNCVRRSMVIDSRADMLVYGMGERQVIEIAQRLKEGESLDGIRGTVVARKQGAQIKNSVMLPSWKEVASDKEQFNRAFTILYAHMNPFTAKTIVQQHGTQLIVQFPPAIPLSTSELDRIYTLPYVRRWHPIYDAYGGVKSLETVRFSIVSHRGCCGECSFCALYFHQGRIVQSRSAQSIIKEAETLARSTDFKGTITDIGGPTANLYGAQCSLWVKRGFCSEKKCLVPEKCSRLKLGYKESLEVYKKVNGVPKVKHVFIGSGFRHDLLAADDAEEYLTELCRRYVSGLLKVAPEHYSDYVLQLMNKPPFVTYEKFVQRFNKIKRHLNKNLFLVNYFISSHPGTSLRETLKLALFLAQRRICPQQIQDFIPIPMTVSTCQYYTERDPFSERKVYVSKTFRERKMQRALIQHQKRAHRKWVVEALKTLDMMHMLEKLSSDR